MSHFIKDAAGNYHEYSDEQYAEMQQEESRSGGVALGLGIMGLGFAFGAAFKLVYGESIVWWIGIGVSVIGLLVAKRYATKAELVTLIILAVLAYYGAYWLSSKIHIEENKEKIEKDTTYINIKPDVPMAVFSKC